MALTIIAHVLWVVGHDHHQTSTEAGWRRHLSITRTIITKTEEKKKTSSSFMLLINSDVRLMHAYVSSFLLVDSYSFSCVTAVALI